MIRYRYQPLQYDDSIRLIILHPSLNDQDPIICTIQHARLSDELLNYEALSYTWGSAADRTKTIQFHNSKRELIVRGNCYNALHRLRLGDEDRLLWVDAICINQENLVERSRQVRMMDGIFSCASCVVVFLGEQVTECRALFEELVAAADTDYLLGPETYYARTPPTDTIIRQLEALYDLPWFKRVWVLQEVCAKKNVIFVYGSAITSDEGLRHLSFGYARRTLMTRITLPLALEWIRTPLELVSTPQINLWKLLFASRDFLATDSRDRVFALKSLTGSRQSELNALIDYNQSPEECFTQVATFLLPVLGLRLLVAIRHPHRLEMPSWVPDWSQNLPLNPQHLHSIAPANERKYGIRSFHGKCGNISLELVVTGCRYAEITIKSHVFSFDGFQDAETQMRSLYHSLANLGKFVDMHHDDTTTNNLRQEILDAMLPIDDDLLHLYLNRYGTPNLEKNSNDPYNAEIIRNFSTSLQQCSIALLSNMELAIVPGCAQERDVVFILSGAISACVVRPTEKKHWVLISGDCFIFTEDFRPNDHGLFECDEYIAQNNEKTEVFRIR